MKYHWPKQIQNHIDQICDPFERKEEWIALQIPLMEIPSACVLLTGPAGTGKTTLARLTLKRLSGLNFAEIPTVMMGDVAAEKLGQTEQGIKSAFKEAFVKCKRTKKPAKMPVVFLDEVDAIGWSRAQVTSNSMFYLSIVNTLLTEIDRFMEQGGAIMMATNLPHLLDASLVRRITDTIELDAPKGQDAMKIWQSLMPPEPFGFHIPPSCSGLGWTPNQISKWIFAECRKAFLEKRNMQPSFLNE